MGRKLLENSVEPLAVSIAQAAQAVGVSRRTLTSEIRDGRLRTARVRKRRVVPVEELRAYIRRAQNAEAAIDT